MFVTKTEYKTVTKTTHNFWQLESEWSLQVFAGGASTAENKPLVLQNRKGSCELETVGLNKRPPRPLHTIFPTVELDCTFLLDCIEQQESTVERQITFRIDRDHTDCRTPRRNPQTDAALEHFDTVQQWVQEVSTVLYEQILVQDQILVQGLEQIMDSGVQAAASVQAVEAVLRAQMTAAIGKEIGPHDFSEYMHYHNRRLFQPQYMPRGFCYAVRRPQHDPEGMLSIEFDHGTTGTTTGTTTAPLATFVSHAKAISPMRFALDAATDISFKGVRYLHASVLHTFSDAPPAPLQLQVRARQFSSFVLVVGKIAAADVFEPTGAIIVKDKDDLKIPLLLETIPTPKEFHDAIESMSPEQQRFCKAFRGMQLASTLFGVLVIQIKPQLEKLLKLPDDALTKEIRLTRDLLELFVKYQVPADLLSYGGEEEAPENEKLAAVKGHVSAVREMVVAAEEEELEQAKQEARKKKMVEEAAWAEEERVRMQRVRMEKKAEEDRIKKVQDQVCMGCIGLLVVSDCNMVRAV
jgi:hypothetical protein